MTSSFNNPSSQQNAETLGTTFNAAIQPKMNNTADVEPTPEELIVGELAVNTADAKLFVKHTDGTVKSISGSGGGGSAEIVWSITDNSSQPIPTPNQWYYFVVDSDISSWDGTGGRVTGFYSGYGFGMEETDLNGLDLRSDPLFMVPPPEGEPGLPETEPMYASKDGGKTWEMKWAVDLGPVYDPATQTYLDNTVDCGVAQGSPDFPESFSGLGNANEGESVIFALVDPATTGVAPTAAYLFNGPGFPDTGFDGNLNPDLYVIRGQNYKISNDTGSNPLQIQSAPGLTGAAYNAGVINNGISTGIIEWEVRMDAPDELYYQNTSNALMGGKIYVLDAPTPDIATGIYDDTQSYRFLVVETAAEVTGPGLASCRDPFQPDPLNNAKQFTVHAVDYDGKNFAADPLLADNVNGINTDARDKADSFWFALNGGPWVYAGRLDYMPPTGDIYSWYKSSTIKPEWTAGDILGVYISPADGTSVPGPRATEDKDLLVYDAASLKWLPGRSRIQDSSDYRKKGEVLTLIGPGTSEYDPSPLAMKFYYKYTYPYGTLDNDKMIIRAYSPIDYLVHFDYRVDGTVTANVRDKAAEYAATNAGSFENMPFWLQDMETGVITSHFGTFTEDPNGGYGFDPVSYTAGDSLPKGFGIPTTFTLWIDSPYTEQPNAKGDILSWSTDFNSWQVVPPTSVNGKTDQIDLNIMDLSDVTANAFSEIYYYTTTSSLDNIDGGTNALLTTNFPPGGPGAFYLIMDTVDANGNDIAQDPVWFTLIKPDFGGPHQPMWWSLDGGVTWTPRHMSSYGFNNSADNPAGTSFLGIEPGWGGLETYPPEFAEDGNTVLITLKDPTNGQVPLQGEALVAQVIDPYSSEFVPTRVVTLAELKLLASASADYASFQAAIAAL